MVSNLVSLIVSLSHQLSVIATLMTSSLLFLTDTIIMRIALVFATLIFGFAFGAQAIATVNEYQERRADQFCQVDPNYCNR